MRKTLALAGATLCLFNPVFAGLAQPAAAAPLAPAVSQEPAEKKTSRFDEAVAAYDAGDFETAFRIWRRLGRQGDLSAQRNVGQMLRLGTGIPQDLKAARKAYRKAAEAGYPPAMANLGLMLRDGQGGKPDARKAAFWFYRAAKLGSANGQYLLGLQLETGSGVTRDKTKALAFYSAAAALGHAQAKAAAHRLAGAGTVLPVMSTEQALDDLEAAPQAKGDTSASNSPPRDLNTLLKGTGAKTGTPDAADPDGTP